MIKKWKLTVRKSYIEMVFESDNIADLHSLIQSMTAMVVQDEKPIWYTIEPVMDDNEKTA